MALPVSACPSPGDSPVDFSGVMLSFEDGTDPATVSRGSSLRISDRHSKFGTHSLEWSWNRQGQKLDLLVDVPYLKENPNPKETSVSSFVFWVYSSEPIEGQLDISFYKDVEKCCGFSYGLGFTGWRGAWVDFDRDMEGAPEEGMDRIVITAPKGVKRGTLFFDGIIPASFQDVRYHTPDWQAPFINRETTSHWLVLNRSWNLKLDIPIKSSVSEAEVAGLDTVRSRFVHLVTDKMKPESYGRLKEIHDSYHISRNPDGTIRGLPIFFIRYGETLLNLGISDASEQFRRNGQLLREANDNLLKFAIAWLHEKDPEKKLEYASMYINLTELLLDQGFAAGSALGTLHHLGYSMRNFYTAPVIMSDVLRDAGLSGKVQQAMEWFSGVGEVKIAPREPGMDIDAFNTSLMGRVASLLMLDDTPYKYAYFQALSRWIDNGMKYTEGLRPCFKRDGTVVHHRKAYPAYATGGMDGAVKAVWMLSGTDFAVSEESHDILKKALLEMRFYCNKESFPLAMSGRHPDGKGALIPAQYALLADAGSPNGKYGIDPELAQAYLRLASDGKWAEKFEAAGFTAEPSPRGTRVYPYACTMVHRLGDWSVVLAGHSRYIWATETYQNANMYGRYLTHGSEQIMADGDPPSATGSGYQVDGFDWRHIPGTTAAAVPMEQMKSNVLNVDEFSGYEEMLLSDEWFAGGVTHKGESGVFSMKLHEHDKYNGSLRARKSWFAHENMIVALGSDIENSLSDTEVHTTLFQNAMPENAEAFQKVSDEELSVLRDHFGNAWLVKDGLVISGCALQQSFHEETCAPTAGGFEKAYIRHGNLVGKAHVCGDIYVKDTYEYMMLIHPSDSQVEACSEALPYKVLELGRNAHAVQFSDGLVCYAVFEECDLPGLLSHATPSLIMYSVAEDGQMTLSVCNPDLALYEGSSDEIFDADGKRVERSIYGRKWVDNPGGEVKVSLSLEGEWEKADPDNAYFDLEVNDGKSYVTVTDREAATREIVLRPVGSAGVVGVNDGLETIRK